MNALVLLLAVENIRFKWGLKESFIFQNKLNFHGAPALFKLQVMTNTLLTPASL